MIYYCKGVSLLKLKMMCKLYVSQLLPCPRESLCTSVVRYFPLKLFQFLVFIFRAVGLAQLFQFQSVYLFGVHWFNKHVEKGFWQHGLGTSYSNSACFDKDDIWRKKNVQCMSTMNPFFTLNRILVKLGCGLMRTKKKRRKKKSE